MERQSLVRLNKVFEIEFFSCNTWIFLRWKFKAFFLNFLQQQNFSLLCPEKIWFWSHLELNWLIYFSSSSQLAFVVWETLIQMESCRWSKDRLHPTCSLRLQPLKLWSKVDQKLIKLISVWRCFVKKQLNWDQSDVQLWYESIKSWSILGCDFDQKLI